jgi:hypothetical protein
MSYYGFDAVLSFEEMLDDLDTRAPAWWPERLSEIRRWNDELMDFLERG